VHDGSVSFPDHLEAFLGEMEGGKRYAAEEDGQPTLDVVRFPDQPMEGASTYATVGLSKVLLHRSDDRHIRQELLCVQEDEREPYEAGRLLATVAEMALHRGDALMLGQIIAGADPLDEDSVLEALVCLHPGYFPADFDVFQDPGSDVPVAVVMLVPVTGDEAEFVRSHGVDAFTDLVGDEDPNLLDWRRPPFLRWVETGDVCPDCGQSRGHFHLPDGRVPDVGD
jgi:Suppressor of fused protein (SUFU)